jgi:hypothetical protein
MINHEGLFDFWEEHQDEFLKFEAIENAPYPRPDICAFIKLHELVPRASDIVAAAEHDEIYLDVSPEELCAVASEADLIYLHRCGIRYDSSTDSLAMFV